MLSPFWTLSLFVSPNKMSKLSAGISISKLTDISTTGLIGVSVESIVSEPISSLYAGLNILYLAAIKIYNPVLLPTNGDV
jgi:hypothetical protein